MSTLPSSPAALWRLVALLLAAAALAVAAADDGGMTHLHFYIHETFTGANATAITVVAANGCGDNSSSSSFGTVGAFDDELREGSDAASRYLGRAEGALVQADLANPAASCTLICLAFTEEGDYSGSTLLVSGRAELNGGGGGNKPAVVERAVVGGTGRFRRARGYSLMTKVGNPTPSTGVFEMDIYVKMTSTPGSC